MNSFQVSLSTDALPRVPAISVSNLIHSKNRRAVRLQQAHGGMEPGPESDLQRRRHPQREQPSVCRWSLQSHHSFSFFQMELPEVPSRRPAEILSRRTNRVEEKIPVRSQRVSFAMRLLPNGASVQFCLQRRFAERSSRPGKPTLPVENPVSPNHSWNNAQ